ncbi:MAG: OmpA family protein [Desulfobacterales bacterium]|jgi:chemotaxis protein MotB|nr:OmpA family protein [Desulfobacterales bacterium]
MASKGKESGPEFKADSNAWMATFADLVMLLLTFFVLLLTMKSMDAGKVKEMFVPTYGPLDFIQEADQMGDALEFDHYIKSVVISSTEALEEAIDLLDGMNPTPAKERPMVRLRDIMEMTDTERGVSLVLRADNLFESGEAEIRVDRLHILDEIGRLFRYAANDILVMGHTDNVPLTGGRFAANMELSAYRALSVLYYLTDSLGLKPERLAAGGYGELLPRYSNDNPENRSKNRRVEFLLKKAI